MKDDIWAALAAEDPPPCARCINADLCTKGHLACTRFYQYVATPGHGRSKKKDQAAGVLNWMRALPPMVPRRDIYLELFPEPNTHKIKRALRAA